MSDPYRKAKGGRLTFKGGDLATVKSIDKKKKKKQKNKSNSDNAVSLNGDGAADFEEPATVAAAAAAAAEVSENIYTIDAAKKMKYEELFPVESRKFGYDPLNKAKAGGRSIEEALDDRVKKKADRYCK